MNNKIDLSQFVGQRVRCTIGEPLGPFYRESGLVESLGHNLYSINGRTYTSDGVQVKVVAADFGRTRITEIRVRELVVKPYERYQEVLLSRRGTGRTTRMMEDAAARAARGENVIVIFHSSGQASSWKDFADDNGLRIAYAGMSGVDLGEISVSGHNGTVLVDHYVFENEFARHLEMLHRYDT